MKKILSLLSLLFCLPAFSQVANTNAWVWASFEDLNGFETTQLTVASISNAFAVYPNIIIRKNKAIPAYNGVISNQYAPGAYSITTPLGDSVTFYLPPGFDNTHVFNILDLTNSITNLYVNFPYLTHSNGVILQPTNFFAANFTNMTNALIQGGFSSGGGTAGSNTVGAAGAINLSPALTNMQSVTLAGNGPNTNVTAHTGDTSGAFDLVGSSSNLVTLKVHASTNTLAGNVTAVFEGSNGPGTYTTIDAQGGVTIGGNTNSVAGRGSLNATNQVIAQGGMATSVITTTNGNVGVNIAHTAGQGASRLQFQTSTAIGSNAWDFQKDTDPGESGGQTGVFSFYSIINGMLTNRWSIDPYGRTITFVDAPQFTGLAVSPTDPYVITADASGHLHTNNAPSTNIMMLPQTVATNPAAIPSRGFMETVNGFDYFTPDPFAGLSNIVTIKTGLFAKPWAYYGTDGNLYFQGQENFLETPPYNSNIFEISKQGYVVVYQSGLGYGILGFNTNASSPREFFHIDNATNTDDVEADTAIDPSNGDLRNPGGDNYQHEIMGDGGAVFRKIYYHWPIKFTNYTFAAYSDHIMLQPTNGPANVILLCPTNPSAVLGFNGRGIRPNNLIYADVAEVETVWNTGTNIVTCFATNHNSFNARIYGGGSASTNFIVYPGHRVDFTSPDGTNLFAWDPQAGTNYSDGSTLTNLPGGSGANTVSNAFVINVAGIIANNTNLTVGSLSLQLLTNGAGTFGTAAPAASARFSTAFTNTLTITQTAAVTNYDLFWYVSMFTGTGAGANVYFTNAFGAPLTSLPDCTVVNMLDSGAMKSPDVWSVSLTNIIFASPTAETSESGGALGTAFFHAHWHNP